MYLTRLARTALACVAMAAIFSPAVSQAGPDEVTIGVLTDISGPYGSIAGNGSIVAAQMAVEDFGGKVLGKPIKVISADHLNKPDIGASIARKWFDADGVNAIFDLTNSAVSLAVVELARERGRVVAFSGPSTADLTGKACTATTTHWAYDTYSLVNGSVKVLLQQGVKSWFFLALDATGGRAIEAIGTRAIKEGGGTVVGNVHHPLNTPDFSSFLLQAQQSGAQAIALANAGADTVNSIKQAGEFGLPDKGIKLVGLIFLINDVHAVGLKTAHGAILSETFYWDLNDDTRAWNKRFMSRHGTPANMIQAGVYSSVMHYLKSMQKAETDDGKAVSKVMRELPINDALMKDIRIRADGRVMRDVYIFRVKSLSESKAPWDYYETIGRISAEDAFRPAAESDCPLMKK
jgi:branched-chain amino acid transport system substrate-binding protein